MSNGLALTTDGLSGQEAAQAWSDWMAGLFSGLSSDLYGDTNFEGHLRVQHAGSVVMTKLEASRHRVMRSVQGDHTNEVGYLKIVAPWEGEASVLQSGHQASARNGSWVIYDTTVSYEVANPGWSELLIVMLPKQAILNRGIRLEGLMGRNVGGSTGMARIALETMRSVYQELTAMSPQMALRAGELLIDMVHLSLQELAEQSYVNTHQLALKERIRSYVVSHLRDSSLSVEGVAQALNCSKRHLHNTFADEPQSLGNFIQQSRLELCMRELLLPELRERTITDIAMGCGFGSSAHFSRAFKAYTGMSPREFRAIRIPH
ncbi:helix-turn-helix domain-containing protein [Comamonas sp. NoAH]|uniref:helix-turn-helix domain-containing protein n=1 Tax=Comamonas halotolerans TaxID=3041496 RepID=UPI0024E156C6|nr:helix-turn-helix domain-containing protein [Comamonas sp. NoAH]